MLSELSLSKYLGDSLELLFFPVHMGSEENSGIVFGKAKEIWPSGLGQLRKLSTRRIWKNPGFFSPAYQGISFQIAQIILHEKLPVL